MEFKKYKLNEVLTLNPTLKLKKNTIAKKIAMENIKEYQKKIDSYTYSEFKSGSKFMNGDTLLARITPCLENGKTAYVDILDENEIAFGSTEFFVLRPKDNLMDSHFLYYLMRTNELRNTIIKSMTGTSGRQRAQKESILEYEFCLPSLKAQTAIAKLLKNLDDKIETNKKIIANLQELSQTLFKRWFVDFEFPDENGNPYKSSGGEMVDSELGEIPKEWSIQTLNDISENYNTKRKPLSKLEREKVTSIYPYYGATKIIDYVDDYLFDGKFILVGEDGTVQTEEGHPFVQYVWGKFWVSNHAHILKGNNLSDETLMLILNNIDIEPYITGAVQPKISKKNLNGIKVIIGTKLIYEKFDQYSDIYYKKIREISEEIKNLIELRDTLLPKLMSGELEIPDDIEVNEDELSI
ncbi:restriction endonuclease subunit S [Staphylococcus warneri]|uniref:restriction endonuclease subunit S n=1 Tax=Staphylococcus warneri TaxID=1292 RepID=UPI003CF39367